LHKNPSLAKSSSKLRTLAPGIYLSMLLLFLLGDEICNNYIFESFTLENHSREFALYISFLVIQVFFSPVQAAFSDLYCRKKSLVVSLTFSLVAIACVYIFANLYKTFMLLWIVLLFKGILGNTLPISLAGVADAKRKDTRLAMGLCTGAMSAGYLILILLGKVFSLKSLSIPLVCVFVVLIFICVKYFLDIRDKEGREDSNQSSDHLFVTLKNGILALYREIKLVISELKCKKTLLALITFLFWEISQYSIHMLDVDLKLKEFSDLTTSMVCGYLLGLMFLWLLKKKEDFQMINLGYIIGMCSVLPIFILYPFFKDSKILLIAGYFLYNFGAVFLAPSLFSILAGERKPHDQGKIFGLLDSTDTIAFLIASIVAISYSNTSRNPLFIVSFSLFMYIISWFFYRSFKRLKLSV